MKYVIIGGDAAGMSAAMQIFKYDAKAKITIIEKGEVYSYAQCGIPYVISGDVKSKKELIARDVTIYREKFGMTALVNHEVQQIDVPNKTIIGINNRSSEQFKIEYDKLLIASGANPNIPNWDGVQFPNVHTLKNFTHMEEIMNQLNNDIKNITIIGGGYIGLEMAESFRKLDKNVKIINRSKFVGNIFDTDMAKHIHEEAEKQGVNIVTNESTKKIIGDKKAQYVVTDKGKHKTDLVLISIGISPNNSFLNDTKVKLTKRNAIIVNKWMETNVKDIYAAGDCATQYHRIKQLNDHIPLGTHANKQGRIAGMNMVGEKRQFKGIVGSTILRFFDLALGKTGLSETETKKLNIPYETIVMEGNHIANYYPGAKTLHIKMLYNSETKQLLGAQVIGEEGVDKRIDVLAVALYNEMKMEQLEDLDLSYAPPFNGVWDPIQRAARQAK